MDRLLLLLLLTPIGCATRSLPDHPPVTSPASSQAAAGVNPEVTGALTSEPPLPGDANLESEDHKAGCHCNHDQDDPSHGGHNHGESKPVPDHHDHGGSKQDNNDQNHEGHDHHDH